MPDDSKPQTIHMPDQPGPEAFDDPAAAVARIEEIYATATAYLETRFREAMQGGHPGCRYRACYPELRITTSSFAEVDSRLSFGHVNGPGAHAATITRPALFRRYLEQQIGLLIRNHGVPVTVAVSDTPIPVHFAVTGPEAVAVPQGRGGRFTLRDVFDVPDIASTSDDIVNGTCQPPPGGVAPLAPFTAQRVDYSLARLAHYTATDPVHFQNHVLFTNYQFYVTEFEAHARRMLADPDSGYTGFVSPATPRSPAPTRRLPAPASMPQMPAYHLKRGTGRGSRWSISGSGRRTPRPRPTTSRCCARMPGSWSATARGCAIRSRWGISCLPMPTCARTRFWTTTCRSGCRSRRWPRSRSRCRRPSPR